MAFIDLEKQSFSEAYSTSKYAPVSVGLLTRLVSQHVPDLIVDALHYNGSQWTFDKL
jgi:hypothetical protein